MAQPSQAYKQITSPEIEREIERVGLTANDAWTIREFATFLSMAGPPPFAPKSWTKRKKARIIKRFGSFLGLPADKSS